MKKKKGFLSVLLVTGLLLLGSTWVYADESICLGDTGEDLGTETVLESEIKENMKVPFETESRVETEGESEVEIKVEQNRGRAAAGTSYRGEKFINGHWYYFYESTGVMATGWTEHHGNRYYYNDSGWMLYGHQTIDGKKYFFDSVTGVMYKGEKVVGGHWVYYGNDGAMATGWTEHHGNTYYYNEKGWMLYGRQTINGKKYIFDSVTGVLITNVERVENGHWVYYGNDGAMATGWTEHHGNTYYYNEKGWMLYGSQTIDGKKYNFDSVTGVLITNMERVEGGHWVYYGSDGLKATGWTKHHGNTYYYNEKGWMLYGRQTIDGKKYNFDSVTGVLIMNAERVEGGHWVYYGNDGAMATGWTEHHGNRYYYNEKGWMLYGEQTIDGEKWNFDKVTGALIYGFQNVNGKIYYVDKIHNLYKGKKNIDNKVFLFDESTGELKLGLQTIDNQQYFYINESPYIYTGEKVLNGKWHYFDEKTGEMAVGWSGHHGNHYYYNSNGEMVYGKQTIDGQEYYFNTVTGALVYDNHSIVIPDLYGQGIVTFNGMNSLSPEMQQELNNAIYAITGQGYNVGFVMVDLFTGQGISYNGNQNYYSASTIKGPYVVCLNETLPWSKNEWSNVMTNTIKVSSNWDYSALRRAFGSTQFSGWLSDAGCSWVNASKEYTDITPKALSQLWIKNYSYFTSDQENSMWCADLFVSTKNSFISQTFSQEYKVYSKAGWLSSGGYYDIQSDAGIVMKDGNPYVVTVLSSAYGRQDLLGNLVAQLDKAHSEMIK